MSDLSRIEGYVGKKYAPLVLEILQESGCSLQDESAIEEAFEIAKMEVEG